VIKQHIDLQKYSYLQFTPKISLKMTARQLTEKYGFRFEEDCDDLGEYVCATLEIKGKYYIIVERPGFRGRGTDVWIPLEELDLPEYLQPFISELRLTDADFSEPPRELDKLW
jgi:hypothetical protein